MSKRTENGRAVIRVCGLEPVVPLDIVGKLARVSPSDIIRIAAAIQVLSAVTGIDKAALLDWDSLPTAQADTERARATEALFSGILANIDYEEECAKALQLRRRSRKRHAE